MLKAKNCNTASLDTYANPLTASDIAHLYRRISFGANISTIEAGVGQTADALIDNLVDEALNLPTLPRPYWLDQDPVVDIPGTTWRDLTLEWRTNYVKALFNNGLRERLSFFWSNHLVVQTGFVPHRLAEYILCIQENALGNYREFVRKMGLTAAMLYFLDGAKNKGSNPNENYARELYELFTLGEGNNYTQQDIVETARALSGYTGKIEGGHFLYATPLFKESDFDNGVKTIFGQTGNWGYDDVIDILFRERATEIANFICTKLYRFFVHPTHDDPSGNAQGIIDGLAAIFLTNDFELAPVIRQLLKSQHFFAEGARGVIIKSPFDLCLNLFKELGLSSDFVGGQWIIDNCTSLGQKLFEPPDVAGWQRDRFWIDNAFIVLRRQKLEIFLNQINFREKEQLRSFAIAATGPQGATTDDPDMVARAIVDRLTPKGFLEAADYETCIEVFRRRYEHTSMYEDNTWNMMLEHTPQQVYELLVHLSRMPEFQLK